MAPDPYRVEPPALVSFSGGRTSAFMLHEILRAYGGELPPGVVVAFANTGKEREETLRFVHECGTRWGVHVHWLEWRDGEISFEEVGYNSAARAGEPFQSLIESKQRLPNGAGQRWCSEYLKVRPMHDLMRSLGLGEPGAYLEAIGLRNDEGHRILKGFARAEKDGRRICYPLANAKVSKRDVLAFWWGPDRRWETRQAVQGFDLDLPPLWGNCDLCFVMGAEVRRRRIQAEPAVAGWWRGMEDRRGATFSMRESVADLERQAAQLADADEAQSD